jgi:hypothetical protein
VEERIYRMRERKVLLYFVKQNAIPGVELPVLGAVPVPTLVEVQGIDPSLAEP